MKPVHSMTGSGVVSGTTPLGEMTVELRSVNGRALSIKSRLAPECHGMEAALEKQLRAMLGRGTVTIVVNLTAPVLNPESMMDDTVAKAAAERLRRLADDLGLAKPTLSELLMVPGVISAHQSTRMRASFEPPAEVVGLLDEAIDQLQQSRVAEGAATVTALREQLDALEERLRLVQQRVPELVREYRERLKARVDEFLDGRGKAMEDADVLREVALFAERSDVAEELQRLEMHISRARQYLDDGGVVGRNLEFLMQEFLREVNTLGSKISDAQCAHEVVAMKACIDKLKEQAANIE